MAVTTRVNIINIQRPYIETYYTTPFEIKLVTASHLSISI